MNIHLIAVGTRMPEWITRGYEEYSKRMPRECNLKLVEIAPGHRGKNASIGKAIEDEGKRMLAAIPKGANVIALDERGKAWSTLQLSKQLEGWMQQGSDTALLIGGPDGLADSCRTIARNSWSLSALTLPHPLVRVLLAEQLYRALTVLQGHPYHRE